MYLGQSEGPCDLHSKHLVAVGMVVVVVILIIIVVNVVKCGLGERPSDCGTDRGLLVLKAILPVHHSSPRRTPAAHLRAEPRGKGSTPHNTFRRALQLGKIMHTHSLAVASELQLDTRSTCTPLMRAACRLLQQNGGADVPLR